MSQATHSEEAAVGSPPPNLLNAGVFLTASGHRVLGPVPRRVPLFGLRTASLMVCDTFDEGFLSLLAETLAKLEGVELLLAHQTQRPSTDRWVEYQLLFASQRAHLRPLRSRLQPLERLMYEIEHGPPSRAIRVESGRQLSSNSANLARFRSLGTVHLSRPATREHWKTLFSQRFHLDDWLSAIATTPSVLEAHRLAHRIFSSTPFPEHHLELCPWGGFSRVWETAVSAQGRPRHMIWTVLEDLEAAALDCSPAERSLRLRLLSKDISLEEIEEAVATVLLSD